MTDVISVDRNSAQVIRATLRLAGIALLALLLRPPVAGAQSNVRAWSASGQVFVVWQVDATAPLAYEVYRASTPLATISQGTFSGRAFEPEWTGARLKLASPTARWRIPSATGGVYQLAANEGLFVFTPRSASVEYFAVVRNGQTSVSSANRTSAPVTVVYDPITHPVTCHPQLAGTTQQGYPFRVFAMWAYGRDDPHDGRPDMPVLANAAKHGAPHVFTVEQLGVHAGDAHRVAAPREGIALRVGVEEVEHAALADHRVVVDVLLEPFPELERPLVEGRVAWQQVVRADDGGVAPDVARADVALFQHRDTPHAVVLRQVVGRGQAMTATAHDHRVVGGLRAGVTPGRLPAALAGQGLPKQRPS